MIAAIGLAVTAVYEEVILMVSITELSALLMGSGTIAVLWRVSTLRSSPRPAMARRYGV